jgi:hypothetical protein
MNTENTRLLPLPEREELKPVTIELSRELYAVARAEMKKRNLTVRKIVEWGLANFLISVAPEEAKRLGIRAA